MRALWTGDQISHHGRHYTVENARLYSTPDEAPPVHVSGFGPEAVSLAARIADGYCGKFACGPDLEEHLGSLHEYRDAGYDEIFISQIGPTSEAFFRFAREELLPAARDEG